MRSLKFLHLQITLAAGTYSLVRPCTILQQVQKCWFSCVVSYPKKIAKKSFSAHQDLASSSWGFLAFHSRSARLNNLSPRHSAHIFHLQDEKGICGVSKSWGHPMVGNPMPQSITKNLKAGFILILNEIMYYIRLPLYNVLVGQLVYDPNVFSHQGGLWYWVCHIRQLGSSQFRFLPVGPPVQRKTQFLDTQILQVPQKRIQVPRNGECYHIFLDTWTVYVSIRVLGSKFPGKCGDQTPKLYWTCPPESQFCSFVA